MLVDLKSDVSQTQTLVVFQFVQGKRTECIIIEVSHDLSHTYLPNQFYSMNTSLCLNNKQAFPYVFVIALHLAWDTFFHHLPLISTPAWPFLVGHLISYLLRIFHLFTDFFLLPIMSPIFKLAMFILHPLH